MKKVHVNPDLAFLIHGYNPFHINEVVPRAIKITKS
jgi:hypothetical protein